MVATIKRAAVLLGTFVLLLPSTAAVAASAPIPPPSVSQAADRGRTPPRLSYIDGEVSFWRPGAPDWTPAQVNLPLAPGDELYVGEGGNVEVQVGARAFVRAASATQVGITNQEPDFLQLKITSGHIALDVRSLNPGQNLELDTPHAAFTIAHPGYYRADVAAERTSFVTRRAGQATLSSAGGGAVFVAPSEEVVLEGTDTPQVLSYVAPDLDPWDQWNYARTDHVFETLSARYVSPGTYGLDELDHDGTWRVVPEYGAVWVPDAVAPGWAPYSTGRWIMDPSYGWTWLDSAPWGWAPFHYGRWVFVNQFWAWAPGPVIVRPVYAPALVAFFATPGIRISVDLAPAVSWVALGWGEPIVPWWGRTGFVGRPWWGGWGGPRVVNNVVINRTNIVNVNNITVYRNTSITNAVVAVPREHFAARSVPETRIADVPVARLQPVRGALAVRPEPSSFVASPERAGRPPAPVLSRPVVATRAPQRPVASAPEARARVTPSVSAPVPRVVPPPRPASAAAVPARVPFGDSRAERPRPPLPPRFEARAPALAVAPPSVAAPHPSTRPLSVAAPHPSAPRLPGEPANRLAPHRAPAESPHRGSAGAEPPRGSAGAEPPHGAPAR